MSAAGEGNTELHKVATKGRDFRDAQPESEAELQTALIAMIPVPGGPHDAGGLLVIFWLSSYEASHSELLFLLDMVLPQLDAYHAGRHLQHLQPWVSVELMQQQKRGQTDTQMPATYQYEAHALWLAFAVGFLGVGCLFFFYISGTTSYDFLVTTST